VKPDYIQRGLKTQMSSPYIIGRNSSNPQSPARKVKIYDDDGTHSSSFLIARF